ncbi:unnamed protein product [Urochloa decumbens]|uniref:Uncharacterized protein n=1 Tax=Urochloa decumbens TaxID=240449 RepID=A0ABC9CGW0_9POAL
MPLRGGCRKEISVQTLRCIKMPLQMLLAKAHLHVVRGCATLSTIQTKVATVGMDFGCKNSRVAIIESLVPHVVASEIERYTPSYVTLTELDSPTSHVWCMQHLDRVGKRVATGQIAKFKMLRRPSDVVRDVKKLIGKQFDDPHVQEMRKRIHFSIIEGPSGEAWVEIHGVKFSPVEISSAIFAKLKDTVLMYQFHHKLQVVVSVPPFFSEQQREDIKLAGNTAGLDVLQVIDDPTAAVLSSTTNGIVVVFGMGAGSYSISIHHMPNTNIKDMKVKAQSGDPCVGGDQFDNILLDHFVSKIVELHSVDIRGDKYAMTLLAEKAEQVKVDLSSQPKVTVSIPFFTGSAEGPVHLNITISRPEFEKLVEDLVGQIQHKCQQILKDANITDSDINGIVLYGGMTRMPKIREIIYEVFGKHQISKVNPEEAVVIGSAIHAALFVEEHQEIREDVIPLSIGIESANGTFTRVIPRHTTLPARQTVTIPSWSGDGKCAHVRIFLGEHAMCGNNLPLGEVQLINNRSSYNGSINFEVTFEVNKNYVLKVCARDESVDQTSEVLKTLRIGNNVLCKHYVNKAVRDALLKWATKINDPWRMLAQYALNTLYDVSLSRRDKIPQDLYEDAVNVLTDLREALDTADVVLKDKVLAAESMVAAALNWMPCEPPQSDSLDSE